MIGRKVDLERSFSVEDSISMIYELESRFPITFMTSTVKRSQIGDINTTKAAILDKKKNKILAEASGKGVGKQAEASGLYEALEHAAFRYKLPGMKQIYQKNKINNQDIADVDFAYRYAMKKSLDMDVDTIRFFRLEEDFTLSSEFLDYPAILSDIRYPIYKNMGDLVPLSYYSTNTGIASGCNLKDALLHAINELIERDAESKFLLDINKGSKSFEMVSLDEGDYLYDVFIELTGGYPGKGAIYSLDSICGYVFCVQSETLDGKEELGFGASMNPSIALERAITELQQLQYAKSIGSTWKDEGGTDLSNLNNYPNMQKIASRIFKRPKQSRVKMKEVIKNANLDLNPVAEVFHSGFTPYARVLWKDELSGICVAQVLVPGFESLNNLIFCRPILPVGHLRNDENIKFLLSR